MNEKERLEALTKELELKVKEYDEIKKKVDTSELEQKELKAFNEGLKVKHNEIEKLFNELKEKTDKLQKYAEGLETEMKRPGMRQKSEPRMLITKDDEQYQNLKSGRDAKWPNLFNQEDLFRRKDAIDSSGLTAITSVDRTIYPDIVVPAFQQMKLRDLIGAFPMDKETMAYLREVGHAVLATKLTAQASSGQPVIVVENGNGLYPGQTLNLVYSDATVQSYVIDSITRSGDAATVTFTSNLTKTYAADTVVNSDTFSATPKFKLSPSMTVTVEAKTAVAKSIVADVDCPRDILDDLPQFNQFLTTEVAYKIRLSEEQQILYGNGGERELDGILMDSSIHTYKWSDGLATDTQIDAIRRGRTQIFKSHYEADGLVINPTDLENIETIKDSLGRYILENIVDGDGVKKIWRMPVVETLSIAEGEALIGNFKRGMTMGVRREVGVEVFMQHADYPKRRLALIQASERVATAIWRPQAFCKVTFDNAPSGS